MKKIYLVSVTFTAIFFSCCHNNSVNTTKSADSSVNAGSNSRDSAANNGIIPPSASPGNATNSSLADTAYKAKDSEKKH